MSLPLLEQLRSAATDEDRERLVLQISLGNLAPPLHRALHAAAVLHWFDAEYLGALLQVSRTEAEKLVHGLSELSYIEHFPDGSYDVHESTRGFLLGDLWRDQEEYFKELSAHAAYYCESRDLEDARWRIEWLYHLLLVDPLRATRELDATCRTWYRAPNFAYGQIEAILRGAREHDNAGRLPRAAVNTLLLWEARLDLNYGDVDHYRRSTAREKLSLIAVDASAEPQLAADASYVIGRLHLLSNKPEEARARLTESLALYEKIRDVAGVADANLALGEVERILGDPGAAREHFRCSQANYLAIGDEAGQAKSNEFSSSPEQLLLEHLDFIENSALHTARRFHLKQEEREELAAVIKLKMVEDDYAVFRKFTGRSSLRTYLTVVIRTIASDYMTHLFGKWRPSQEALRLGRVAQLLEMLLARDGYSFEEASKILRTTYEIGLSDEELGQLAARLPRRVVRRFIGEENLLRMAAPDEGGEQRAIAREISASKQRALAALKRALSALPEEDRRLVTMRTSLSVAEISRALGLEQKPLYRKLEKIHKTLRQTLSEAGIRREDIEQIFDAEATAVLR